MMPTLSLDKAYNEVLGRLARYKNMNPQLALNLITDKHLMITMAYETDEQKIDEKIENKFVDMASQLQTEKQTLVKDIQIEKNRFEKLEEKIRNVESALEETQTENRKQVEEIEKTLKDEKRNRVEAEKESEDIKKKFEEFRKSMVRWGIFVCTLGLASSFLWFHHNWLDWVWLRTHKNGTLIELASQFLLIFVLLNIPLKNHWKTWLGFIVATALGILTLSSLN
jgi:hypothetical protein